MTQMPYNRLGTAGVKVSALSFGSWVTFDEQLDVGLARDCMEAAWEHGVNFFDNAEVYAGGKSEEIMGRALAELDWDRDQYLVSTKFYWGIKDGVNTKNTLNRKYLMQAIDASLARFDLDAVDLVFCHRSDAETPIEETVWAMHDIIESGKAHYWGTSEWSADEIRAAIEIAERHHLRKPVMEQPQYNLMWRRRVEKEYARIFADYGYGTTTWSPLASGLLTGKYLDGVPEDSRANLPGYEWLKDMLTDPARNEKVRRLKDVADDLDVTLAQLSIAWCAKNPNVSTVITGASKVEQVHENMKALDALVQLDDDVMRRIEDAVAD